MRRQSVGTLRKRKPTSADELAFKDTADFVWRHKNFGRLLLNAFRFFEQGLLVRIHAMGYPEIKRVHLGVMRQMDLDGTRITILADRAGVTKQAMSHFVQECEDLGFVDRQADLEDGRAKIVCFTAKGKRFITNVKGVIDALETEIVGALGRKRADEMRESLGILADRLGQDDILFNTKG